MRIHLIIRLIRRVIVALACLPTVVASGARAQSVDVDAPMRFFAVESHINVPHITPGVLAIGSFKNHADQRLGQFLAAHPSLDHPGDALYILSGGGDLGDGLRFGELVRRHRLQTFVGLPTWYADHLGIDRYLPGTTSFNTIATIFGLYPSVCASACTFAFLGGTARTIVRGSLFLVHRSFLPRNSPLLQNPKFNREASLAFGERAMAQMSAYAAAMGISPEFVLYVAHGGHSKDNPILLLSHRQLVDLNVVTQEKISSQTHYPPHRLPVLSILDRNGEMDAGRLDLTCDASRHLFIQGYFRAMPSPPMTVTLHLVTADQKPHDIAVPYRDFRLSSTTSGATVDVLIPPDPFFTIFDHAQSISIRIKPTTGQAMLLTDGIGLITPIPGTVQRQIYELARSC